MKTYNKPQTRIVLLTAAESMLETTSLAIGEGTVNGGAALSRRRRGVAAWYDDEEEK